MAAGKGKQWQVKGKGKGKKAENGSRSPAARRGAGAQARGGKLGSHPEEIGTPDQEYDLISILYHALQGAEVYLDYAEDAEEAGDSELAEFLREVQQEEARRAERAKQLLAGRLSPGRGGRMRSEIGRGRRTESGESGESGEEEGYGEGASM
jgi:hypothetical protein